MKTLYQLYPWSPLSHSSALISSWWRKDQQDFNCLIHCLVSLSHTVTDSHLAKITGDCSRHTSAAETVEDLVGQHWTVREQRLLLNWSDSNVRSDIRELHNLMNSTASCSQDFSINQILKYWNVDRLNVERQTIVRSYVLNPNKNSHHQL